jgi:hypothetical protein
MDFLTDFDLFNQILVSPDHITIVYSFLFFSIQITIHIEINLSRPISYLPNEQLGQPVGICLDRKS